MGGGGGEGKKKQMLQKKKIKGSSKRGMRLENPGEGAAGALAFSGINVTVLLPDSERHKEPMSSRGSSFSFLIHFSPFSNFLFSFFLWSYNVQVEKRRSCN